jgi:hypothetical protein
MTVTDLRRQQIGMACICGGPRTVEAITLSANMALAQIGACLHIGALLFRLRLLRSHSPSPFFRAHSQPLPRPLPRPLPPPLPRPPFPLPPLALLS